MSKWRQDHYSFKYIIEYSVYTRVIHNNRSPFTTTDTVANMRVLNLNEEEESYIRTESLGDLYYIESSSKNSMPLGQGYTSVKRFHRPVDGNII